MLITNFAAGELSKNLFGRIDLPQYHCGAARLENFDVIPTGGIKRRSGTERILELEGGGRIIPFYINRDVNFLIHLFGGRMRVYKITGGGALREGEEITPESGGTLYSDGEIKDVQYSQNFNTMVLTHENHPPREVVYSGGSVSVKKINFNFIAETVKSAESDIDETAYAESDKNYTDYGRLTADGGHPRCSAFFNGRLLFAGTKNEPQKIFASCSGSVYRFATYKKMLAEQKKYIVVQGTINKDNTKLIVLDDTSDGLKFTEPLEQYYLDTPFYKKGTKVEKLTGNYLEVSDESLLKIAYDAQIEAELDGLIREFDKYDGYNYETPGKAVLVGSYVEKEQIMYFINGQGNVPVNVTRTYDVYAIPGASRIKIYNKLTAALGETVVPGTYVNPGGTSGYSGNPTVPDDAVTRYELNPDYFYDILLAKVVDDTKDLNLIVIKREHGIINYEGVRNAAAVWAKQCEETMKYILAGADEIYYDNPRNIKQRIETRYINSNHVYIPLYTRKIIEDRVPTPDCGFAFELASGTNDAIKWLAVNRGIILGTEMAEWFIPPDVHAADVRAVSLSKYGSDSVPGAAIGSATCFFQAGRKSLVEYYPNENDHFRANNMALLSPQMLRESCAAEFDFTTTPYAKLFITREDGQIATLLYDRATGTFAWSRVTTGETVRDSITPEEILEAEKLHKKKVEASHGESGEPHPGAFSPPKKPERVIAGKIKSCAALPGGDGFDDVYMLAEREGKYFLERLREDGNVYLDSWREWKFEGGEEKQNLISSYGGHAVVYDEKENKAYPLEDINALPPPADGGSPRYIGHPYRSVFTSMPVVDSEKMQEASMTRLYVRLLDSYIPDIWNRGKTGGGPFDGVVKTANALESSKTDLQFSIIHDEPNRCRILSVYAEV